MKLLLACALGFAVLTSFSVPLPAPSRTAGPLKFSELTLDKARRFEIPTPLSNVVIPTGVAFVFTDAIAPNTPGVGLTINGFNTTLTIGQDFRRFDPPIVARAGDTVSFTSPSPSSVIVGGYLVAQSEASAPPPITPTPRSLADMTLDRANRYAVGGNPVWSLTNPPGVAVAIVNTHGFTVGPVAWAIDGVPVVATNGAESNEFRSPIILGPGQTLSIAYQQGGVISGDIGGYILYPGEY